MEQKNFKQYYGIIIAVIISLAVILSSFIVIKGLKDMKNSENTIVVTGSAKKHIKSDFVIWKSSFSVQSPDVTKGYQQLKSNLSEVKAYLVDKGIDEKKIVPSSISTTVNYKYLSNGQITNDVQSYKLEQTIEIKSTDIDKITDIARKSTELINKGIVFQSMPPMYYYQKIADLKVDMLSQATKNAKQRAKRIAESTGGTIGSLRSADMGVFQITPEFSNDVSDSGINDTSSIDKEITAVVNCKFEIK